MLGARTLLRAVPQARQLHAGSGAVIAGPPSNRISSAEKLGHAIFMSVTMLSVPAYVLVNIRKYRGVE